MPTYALTLSGAWVASCRLTATGATTVTVINTGEREVNFWITPNDTAPVVAPGSGRQLVKDTESTVTLASGDRLWVVGVGGRASATVDASLAMTVQDAFIGNGSGAAVASADPGDVLRVYGALGGVPVPAQWRRGGVDIAGATGVSYAVTGADEGGTITATGTGAHGSAVTVAGSVAVGATPTVTGTISDVSLTKGAAPTSFSVAGAFGGGAADEWEITHPYASIDSSGQVTINPLGAFNTMATVIKRIGNREARSVFKVGIAEPVVVSGGGGGGVTFPTGDFSNIANIISLNLAQAPFIVASKIVAEGDSITAGNSQDNMFANTGYGWSDYPYLNYTPADDTIIGKVPAGLSRNSWPAVATQYLDDGSGQEEILNQAIGGNTSGQRRADWLGTTAANRALPMIIGFGYNNNNGGRPAVTTTAETIDDLNLMAADPNADPSKWWYWGLSLQQHYFGQANRVRQHVRSLGGIGRPIMHEALISKLPAIDADYGGDAIDEWRQGSVPTAFMSHNLPDNALPTDPAGHGDDSTHTGALATLGVMDYAAATMASVIAGTGISLESAIYGVDWSVPEGTKICDLRCDGVPVAGAQISNDFGNADLVTIQTNGGVASLYRGSAAAPASDFVDLWITVVGSAGQYSHGRIQLGDRTGVTRITATQKPRGVLAYENSPVAGAVSILFKWEGTAQLAYIGNTQIRSHTTTGGVLNINNGAGGNQLFGGVNGWNHAFFGYNAGGTYVRVNNGAAQTVAGNNMTLGGNWSWLGNILSSASGMTDNVAFEHIAIWDQDIAQDADLSGIASDNGTRMASNLSMSTPHQLNGTDPLLQIVGGPGVFGSGENAGSLGRLDWLPEANAANMSIYRANA